jgi:formate hydrogenlyase subunit 6/NADH:ubiquinone oxidoreductase subunit I
MGKNMKRPGRMLSQVMSSVFRKPATYRYPFVKVETVDKFRGKLKFDKEKCIGCMICVRDCPSDAIEIEKIGEKKYKSIVFLDRCIYCGLCVELCPKDALENTRDFELAHTDRKSLRVEI